MPKRSRQHREESPSWRPQPQPEPTKPKAVYELLSFAPSSGVGFYRVNDVVYRFDLVTTQDQEVQADREWGVRRQEFDQMLSGESFAQLEELKSFAREHYLRDKKNTYYALLFTNPIGEDLALRTLRLLDHEEFEPVRTSEWLIDALGTEVKTEWVGMAVRLAQSNKLGRTTLALVRELTTLTWPVVLRPALDFRSGSAKRGQALMNVVTYISQLDRPLPDTVVDQLRELLAAAERRLELLSVKQLADLETVERLAGVGARSFAFVAAVRRGDVDVVAEIFADQVDQGVPFSGLPMYTLQQLPIRPNRAAVAIGREFLFPRDAWEVTSYYPSGPIIRFWGEDEDLVERDRWQDLRRFRVNRIDRGALARSPQGIVFSVAPGRIYSNASQRLSTRESYLAEIALVVAFYADAAGAMERLKVPNEFYVNCLHRIAQILNGRPSDREELIDDGALNLTTYTNLTSMYLCGGGFDGMSDVIRTAAGILEEEAGYLEEGNVREPMRLLLSNILAAAWQARDELLVNEAQAALRYTGTTSNVSPLVQLVI